MSREKARRYEIEICEFCGGQIYETFEYKHDHDGQGKPRRVEVAEVSELRGEWEARLLDAAYNMKQRRVIQRALQAAKENTDA